MEWVLLFWLEVRGHQVGREVPIPPRSYCPAHHVPIPAELVCDRAIGILERELKRRRSYRMRRRSSYLVTACAPDFEQGFLVDERGRHDVLQHDAATRSAASHIRSESRAPGRKGSGVRETESGG